MTESVAWLDFHINAARARDAKAVLREKEEPDMLSDVDELANIKELETAVLSHREKTARFTPAIV